MAVEIARSLEEIDNKVKVLNKTLRDSSNETRRRYNLEFEIINCCIADEIVDVCVEK
ncbi:hypothetical protein FACS1894211_00510 [Clostridia bacterium]|nr:hypothetical protein FACS1894211_00510 [Clostridia bacterium]